MPEADYPERNRRIWRKNDLADRAVFLHLPAIAPEGRREKGQFWRSFRELQPQILGGLLDAVVGALREIPSVRLAKLPRMANFARFGEASPVGWMAAADVSDRVSRKPQGPDSHDTR